MPSLLLSIPAPRALLLLAVGEARPPLDALGVAFASAGPSDDDAGPWGPLAAVQRCGMPRGIQPVNYPSTLPTQYDLDRAMYGHIP